MTEEQWAKVKYRGIGDTNVCSEESAALDHIIPDLKIYRDSMLNKVADIHKAIETLEKHPELVEILKLLRKIGI